ncbi:hypothetical protein [Vibrio maritimus]|uniref:hypothetical protein n=1 Tax=Vibrio maritimus TaxID=990268 RepID=UPI001F33F78B|nr:hypothetical protein [Vibrio maritimus]
MKVQVNAQGHIISINALQERESLTLLDIELSRDVLTNPEMYRWNGKAFVLIEEASHEQTSD